VQALPQHSASGQETSSTISRLTPIIVAVAAVLAGVNALDATTVGVFYDDAQYVILGKSIATGNGFRFINLPDAPAATHFPPGYPALLALLWRISPTFPENVALFRIVNALLLGVVAFWTFRISRRLLQHNAAMATLAALAGTATIPPLVLSSNVLSETLFLALLLPFLVAAEPNSSRLNLRHAALLGLGAAVLTLIRSHGIVLLPTIAALYLGRRRWQEAATFVAVALIALMPWFLWVAYHDAGIASPIRGQYGSYSSWLVAGLQGNGPSLLLGTVRQNIVSAYGLFARSFSIAENWVADVIVVAALLVLMVTGAFQLFRRWRVGLVFLGFYLGLVIVWPFSPLRFIWGIWPLVVLVIVSGAQYLWSEESHGRIPIRARRAIALSAGAITLLGAALFNVRGYINSWWATVGRSIGPRIQPHLVWTLKNTDSSDVIAAADDGAIYLYTGRRAVPASAFTAEQYLQDRTPPQNAADLAAIVDRLSPTYVIAWAVPTREAASLLARGSAPLLVRTDTIPGGVVLRPISTIQKTPQR
jgi:hypothetical protein